MREDPLQGLVGQVGLAFYRQPADVKEREIARIMSESLNRFNHEACAKEYIKLYEKMLDRPLVREFKD